MKFSTRLFSYLFASLALPVIGIARLGETPEQLAQRFGPHERLLPDKIVAQGRMIEIGQTLSFRDGDWIIDATIIDGRCAKITYGKRGEWTDDQITQTLNANSQGAAWKMTSQPYLQKSVREWKRGDGGSAIWRQSASLTAANPAYDRAIAKAKAKADADSRRAPKI